MSDAPLRVLCFGDSLTSGYHAWGTGSHPYSTTLARRLREAFPGRRIEVATSGMPGDVVCGPAFHERLASECKSGSVPPFTGFWVTLVVPWGGQRRLFGMQTDKI